MAKINDKKVYRDYTATIASTILPKREVQQITLCIRYDGGHAYFDINTFVFVGTPYALHGAYDIFGDKIDQKYVITHIASGCICTPQVELEEAILLLKGMLHADIRLSGLTCYADIEKEEYMLERTKAIQVRCALLGTTTTAPGYFYNA